MSLFIHVITNVINIIMSTVGFMNIGIKAGLSKEDIF